VLIFTVLALKPKPKQKLGRPLSAMFAKYICGVYYNRSASC